jgi:hypothetical protein
MAEQKRDLQRIALAERIKGIVDAVLATGDVDTCCQ